MPPYTQDMNKVEKWGEVFPEGWYHFRLEKFEDRESKESPGERVIWLWFKCQEEPLVGRTYVDNTSLQPQALAKLKAFYEKAGYLPGPEGHDPQVIVDMHAEYYLLVVHDKYKGETRSKTPPWGIRSLQEGKPV